MGSGIERKVVDTVLLLQLTVACQSRGNTLFVKIELLSYRYYHKLMRSTKTNVTLMKRYIFLIILSGLLAFNHSWAQEALKVCPDVSSSIALEKDKIELNKKGMATVDRIVTALKDYPNCKLLIMSGNHFDAAVGKEIAWEDANAVREYFLSKGISHERMFINYNYTFKKRYVIVRCTESCEDCSTSTPPPPHVLENGRKKTKLIKHYFEK